MPRFDSYSGRISFNPNRNWSLEVSRGFLKSPEAANPNENITRTTASVMNAIILGEKIHWTSTLVWGLNQNQKNEHSVLLESNLQINKTAIYGRYEIVQKNNLELQVPQTNSGEVYRINMLTLGTAYNILTVASTNLRVGLRGSIYMTDKSLDYLYGKNPLAVQVYLQILPQNTNALNMAKDAQRRF